MTWLRETRELQMPRVVDLPKITDRVSFMYVDAAAVRQDETGIVAYSKDSKVRIPCATMLTLFLGPGTSLSQQAALTLARHGTTVVWSGNEGTGISATVRPLASSAAYAQAQATAWADETCRHSVAFKMFEMRFPGTNIPPDTTLDQLRGMEGQRVKATYATLRRIHHLPDWRRVHDRENADPVNAAMNVANSMLYDVASAVIGALGMSPALGFIHSGNIRAFSLDLADMYKMETAAVSAFACALSPNPTKDVRRSMRSYLSDFRVHAGMVKILHELFPVDKAADVDRNDLTATTGTVEGGWNQDTES